MEKEKAVETAIEKKDMIDFNQVNNYYMAGVYYYREQG